MAVCRPRVSERSLSHPQKTDRVAEGIRFVELGLQHFQTSSMAILVNPDHLDIGVGGDVRDERESEVARMFSGMGQRDKFD